MEKDSGLKISVTFPEGLSKELAEKIESGEITEANILDYVDLHFVNEKIVL